MTGELAMSLPPVGSGAGMTGELAMSLPPVGSGAGMTGELAMSLPPVGNGAGMTGELAAAKVTAVNRTEEMIARRTLNVFEVIGPSLSWFKLCTEIVPYKLQTYYNKSNNLFKSRIFFHNFAQNCTDIG
jgi:hypothetical protein